MSREMGSPSIGVALNNFKKIDQFAKTAESWVYNSIRKIRNSYDADPDWTDEHIAELIIRQLEKKFCPEACKSSSYHDANCPVKGLGLKYYP